MMTVDWRHRAETQAYTEDKMTNTNGPAASIEVAESEMDALYRDARRWRYYAGRVATMMGLSIDQMAREIDEAMEAENAAGD